MNNDLINIQKIKLQDLVEFVRNSLDDPAYGEVSPISLLRAESQSKNPQGEPDDIALLVAFYKNLCIGYLGLMPGRLTGKHSVSTIYWMITLYLDAGYRGKGYGKRLLSEMQQLGVDLVATGITRNVEGLCRSMGFRHPAELPYYRLHPENTSYLKNAVKHLTPVEKTFFSKPVNQLTEKINVPAARQDSVISFQRDINTINWMIRNPWVVSRQGAQEDVKQYFFSRVRDLFEFVALEIFAPDEQTRKGYLVLSVSRNKNSTTIKILDYYFHDPKDTLIAGYLGMKWSIAYGADRLEYPGGLAAFFENYPDLRQLTKKKKRLYLFCPRSSNSPLAVLAEKVELKYSDSDTAFT